MFKTHGMFCVYLLGGLVNSIFLLKFRPHCKINKMKKFFLPVVALFFVVGLSSCKKDWTCTCTIMGDVSSEVYTDISRSDARDRCDAQDALAQQKGGTCSLD